MTDEQAQELPFPGADGAQTDAEQVTPPEQAPMDDAAGGPQEDAPETEEDVATQLGDFA